jgi:hypothetical protein
MFKKTKRRTGTEKGREATKAGDVWLQDFSDSQEWTNISE